MTREETINIMKVIVHMLEEKYDTDRVEDAVEMAIKALEQEPKTGWIPVSERLPKKDVDVLVCFYTEERNYKMMVSRRSDYNYWNGVGRTSDMVAWMPLPEPYKAESEET